MFKGVVLFSLKGVVLFNLEGVLFNLLKDARMCDIHLEWILHFISGRDSVINDWSRLFSPLHLINFQSSSGFLRVNKTLKVEYVYLRNTSDRWRNCLSSLISFLVVENIYSFRPNHYDFTYFFIFICFNVKLEALYLLHTCDYLWKFYSLRECYIRREIWTISRKICFCSKHSKNSQVNVE